MPVSSYEIPSTPTGPDSPAAETPTATPEGGTPEQLLAGKYKSQEDLEKGTLELLKKQYPNLEEFYKSLETNQGKPEEAAPKPEAETPPTEPSDEKPREEAKNLLEQSGLKIEDFEQEFMDNGELSDESYTKLQQVLPKQVVDSYIAGQKALADKTVTELVGVVGGQEAFEEMTKWAAENLSQEEIQYFNKAVKSNDMTQAKWAISGLQSRYQSTTGKTPGQTVQKPDLVQGQSASQGTVSGYQSKAEMVKDMQDTRYASDPAFRQQVENKLARTTVF